MLRCAILTDDSPNLGLAHDSAAWPADPTARRADAAARSRPDASAGDATSSDATEPDGAAGATDVAAAGDEPPFEG